MNVNIRQFKSHVCSFLLFIFYNKFDNNTILGINGNLKYNDLKCKKLNCQTWKGT